MEIMGTSKTWWTEIAQFYLLYICLQANPILNFSLYYVRMLKLTFYRFSLLIKKWKMLHFNSLPEKKKELSPKLMFKQLSRCKQIEWRWPQKLFSCRHNSATSCMLIAKSYNRIHNFRKKGSEVFQIF